MKRWTMGVAGGAVLAASACVLPLSVTWEEDSSTIYGSGHLATTTRPVRRFDAVTAAGGIRVVVSRTGQGRVAVTAEENLLPYLETEVRGSTLFVGVRPGYRLAPSREIVFRVDSWEVVEVRALGAVDMDAEVGTVDALAVRVSGASRLTVRGSTAAHDVDVSGASEYDALDLDARRVHLRASGASRAVVWARRRLDVEASGASHVWFRGDPELRLLVSGASTVTRY